MSLENGEGSPGVRVPDPRRLSSLAVTMCLPSGLYAAVQTRSLMSLEDGGGWPESASQTRAVLSSLAVTMRWPSGLYAAVLTLF